MRQQKGFHLAIVAVVILAVAAIGLISWRVYTARPTSQSISYSDGASKAVQPEGHEDSGDGHVIIEEWGVRFKKSDGLEGIKYTVRETMELQGVDLPDNTENIVISTEALQQLNSACNPSSDTHTGIGTIYRSPNQINSADRLLIKLVDGNYYYYSGPQSTCAGAGNEAIEMTAMKNLKESLKSLESTL